MKSNTFDTIVVGAGMSGGWAAKEFTEQGFKTLLLERGPNVEHLKDYPTTNMQPWEFEHRGRLTTKEKKKIPLPVDAMLLEKMLNIFLLKMKNIPIYSKNLLIGLEATK
ncbi:MAG: choline dehydrogenase-like flavoprotein [Flavobacteriaceae bacterium]|jgi:choline dehydrogenase-like flavoprotein|tara:strand:- start:3883 stop:4209 length:327 start_codon:yes stop_codon:yes gene_type:complete